MQTFHTWETNLAVCYPVVCQKHFVFSHTRQKMALLFGRW